MGPVCAGYEEEIVGRHWRLSAIVVVIVIVVITVSPEPAVM